MSVQDYVSATPELAVRPRWLPGSLVDDERWLWRSMLTPAVAYIIALVGFPFFVSLYYSVSNATVGSSAAHFVGLENFRRVVNNPTFWIALSNTVLFTVVTQLVVLVLATALALALQPDFRGKWLVRLLVLLPWVAPISLGSIGWLWMFDSIYSVINWTLRATHVVGPAVWPIWLGQPYLAKASIIAVQVWRLVPLATVIILAGLSSIPQDIHDAAAMDGASFWRRTLEIRFPMVLPITLVALLFGIIFSFSDLIVVFVLTRGGPYDTTQVLASWAYFTGIQGGDLAGGPQSRSSSSRSWLPSQPRSCTSLAGRR